MGYQEDYYQRNREDILRIRALRYASDEAYREATKARARLSNMNRRAVPREVMTTVTFDGKREKFHRVMELPSLLNRNYSVIRQWMLSGIIPRPCCKDGAGKVVFSRSQVDLLTFVIRHVDEGVLHVTYPEMRALLGKLWRKRFNARVTLGELKRMRDGERAGRLHNKNGHGPTQEGKRTRTNAKGGRVPAVRAAHVPSSKDGGRYGRKIRRKDKGDQT